MASTAVERLIGEVEALADVDPSVARVWIRDAWRETLDWRRWSFLHRSGVQLIIPAATTNVSSGATATYTQDSDEIPFSSAIVTDAMVGMQLRRSTSEPLYDIIEAISTSRVRIRPAYSGTTGSGQGFTIYKPYVTMPDDCMQLISVRNIALPRRLRLNYQRELLDQKDSGRTRVGGPPRLLCPLDWQMEQSGKVLQPVRIVGSGTKPKASGIYTGISDALYVVQMTSTAVGGVATFQWKKNEAAYTTGVVTDVTSDGNSLSDGVKLTWSDASTYTSGDLFIIRASATTKPGLMRQELYPHPTTRTILNLSYVIHYPDITDDVEVPSLFARRLNIIRERALASAASAPGKYGQVNRKEDHNARWLYGLTQLSIQDNLIMQRNALRAPAAEYEPSPWGDDPQTTDPDALYSEFE